MCVCQGARAEDDERREKEINCRIDWHADHAARTFLPLAETFHMRSVPVPQPSRVSSSVVQVQRKKQTRRGAAPGVPAARRGALVVQRFAGESFEGSVDLLRL